MQRHMIPIEGGRVRVHGINFEITKPKVFIRGGALPVSGAVFDSKLGSVPQIAVWAADPLLWKAPTQQFRRYLLPNMLHNDLVSLLVLQHLWCASQVFLEPCHAEYQYLPLVYWLFP